MDLTSFMRRYADEIKGQFIEYNHNLSVIIVPVSGSRFQTVLGNVKISPLYNRRVVTFTSKVCPVTDGIDYRMLLEQSAFFNYCRFVISENHIQVEAVSSHDNLSEDDVKEMLQEVANIADQYELKLTGSDVH